MEKIAVLMSTYNGEKYLKQQIDSILRQNVNAKVDLWVRDDGSNDTTCDILQSYAEAGKLNWYNGKNLHSASSFMNLIKNVKYYDYYAFADQDDIWEVNKLKISLEKIRDFNKIPTLFFSNASLVDAELNPIGRNVYRNYPKLDFDTLCCAGGLLGCTMVFNDKLAEALRITPDKVNIIMHDFHAAQVCKALNGKIIYSHQPLVKYRQHSNNVVGVSVGMLSTLRDRISEITQKPSVGIADQARVVLSVYKEIEYSKRIWLMKVEKYEESLFNRLSLAFSSRTHYINLNNSIKIRLAILLKNR